MTVRQEEPSPSRSGRPADAEDRLRQAEQRLRDVEARYETVMSAITESVYDWDIAHDRISFSESTRGTTGLPPEVLPTVQDWWDRIHQEDLPRYRTALAEHLEGNTQRFECDHRYRALDGGWRWARQQGVAQRDGNGRAVRMTGSTADITELKDHERELAGQRAILQTTLENIDQGITMVDKDLHTIALNRRFLELLDLPTERFARGFHMEDAFRFNAQRGEYGPGDVEEQVRQRVELSARFEPHAFERTRPDGRVIAIRGKALPGGGFVSTYSDVTEQRRNEEGLRKSEERYALATSAAAEGIYEWSVDTGKLFLTERAKAFFPLADEELTSHAWNGRVHPDDMPGYRSAIVEHFKGRTQHLEHEYRVADARGEYRWVLDRGIGVRDASGHVTKVVGALSDITQRKGVEMELRRARDTAEEALEQQTATAEILRAISSSPTDTQPVFDAIVRGGLKLFSGAAISVALPDGDQVRAAAVAESEPAQAAAWRSRFPFPLTRQYMHGAAILERRVVDVPDVESAAGEWAAGRRNFLASGYRAITIMPMMRGDHAIGALSVVRMKPGPLSDKQLAVLKTFADQAVIAIENVRLFNEIRESLEQQKAASEILQVISGSIADTAPVFDKIIESCERLFSVRIVGLNLVGPDGLMRIGAFHGEGRHELERVFPLPVTPGSGSGLAIVERRVVHYPDIDHGDGVPAPTRQGCQAIGIKSALFAPMLWEGRGVGVIFVGRDLVSPFSEKEGALLQTFANQAAIAIENLRLFNEIEDKSRQLEIANRHKSQFLANMSHELRTPLNAIIGFTRIVMRRSQAQIEPKQFENLEKILASGQSLLALINAILDLAKVEAGRVELTPGEIDPARLLEQCMRTVEPLINDDNVTLVRAFGGALPPMYVDEEKLRQIVVNLLSNAAKFTAQGSIQVRARAANGCVDIAVTDTGIGIAADKLELVFDEFRQADASSTRVHGGTGLGLTIARRLARLMGGDLRAVSTLGVGSTFTLTLPARYESPRA